MLSRDLNWIMAIVVSFTLTGVLSAASAVAKPAQVLSENDPSIKDDTTLDKKHPNYIRAVLLSKITAYVYWQASAFETTKAPYNLCVLASNLEELNQLRPYLNLLSGREAGGRTFTLREYAINNLDVAPLPKGCHIFYLAGLDERQAQALVSRAAKANILTIGDSMEELYKGAMLAFIEERGRMKIYVNTEALNDSGLKIKSSLLRIAKKI